MLGEDRRCRAQYRERWLPLLAGLTALAVLVFSGSVVVVFCNATAVGTSLTSVMVNAPASPLPFASVNGTQL